MDRTLQAAELRFRTLFEYAQEGILLADAESYYVDANPSACRMLGYARDELIGLHASDIVAPREIPAVSSALSEIHGLSDHHREWQFRRKDGTHFGADVIATKMPDGTLLGVFRDISDRQQAEEYRAHLADVVEFSDTMIDSMPGVLYFYDAGGRFLRWNRNFEAVSGYSGEEIERMHPLDFFSKDDRPLVEQRIADVFNTGSAWVEAAFVSRDGAAAAGASCRGAAPRVTHLRSAT